MTDRAAPAELSVRAIATGLMLGALLAAANVYAGLKIAFVDAGATTIVLLVFSAGRQFTAREVNVAQVAGSSASAMAVTAGLIGPIPALALAGREVAPLALALWGCAVAVFGTLVALPFRARMVDDERLAFPSARATGELMRTLFVDGGRGLVAVLGAAAAVAVAVTVARDGFHRIPGGWMLPVSIGGVAAAQLSVGVAASPLLVGVGLLAGARTAASMLLGAAVAWIAIAPRLSIADPGYGTLVSWTLWPGAALMIAGSLTGLALEARRLVRAFAREPARPGATAIGRAPLIGLAAAGLAIIACGWWAFGVHPLIGAIAVVLAAVCSVAAMQATGETDTTPAGALGGVAQIAVGPASAGDVAAPLSAGGAVGGVAAHAATMLNAWKAGAAVDATPARLVVAQLCGIAVGSVAAVVAFWLIREAYGLGTTAMPVPGAQSWRVTADAVVGGLAAMPSGAPVAALIGALAGVALTMLGRVTRLRGKLPSPIAAGIGFLLPASVTATLAIAAIAAAAAGARLSRTGPVIATGLIVGEGLAGVAIATAAVLG